ncbi:hypothetical protein [Kribbella sp. CA-293567]|uniref:hypothetical protein n=1 Tax=Kribbella sp. CA-293567 TaxID=3002436 RepID=UPI0022DE8320|nr:hypothetical protein [Kribbella sp. CA-293567]WBQ05174.1 hypothetical protein OX958_35155 [Kribbella sp. CA-293567]
MAGSANAGVQAKPEPGVWPIGKATAKAPQSKAQAAAAACDVLVGAVSTAGVASATGIKATRPLSVGGPAPFKFFSVRASSTWYYVADGSTTSYYSALVLQGANLYVANATFKLDAPAVPSSYKLGTGWSGFSTIATSNYVQGPKAHGFLYGLHANGSLYRYDVSTGAVRAYGSAPGYKAFRAITVISETAGYDTLLATTTAGALWTIRIPVTAPFKATLELVRSTGFKGHDQLVAQRCGASSTLLAGLNKANNKATVYAMSRAVGTKTVLNTLGTVEINADPGVRFLRTDADGPQLVGE